MRNSFPAQRHAKIFQLVDALAPGASFVLVNDHDPKPLYYQLEAEHPKQFSWTYIEKVQPFGASQLASCRKRRETEPEVRWRRPIDGRCRRRCLREFRVAGVCTIPMDDVVLRLGAARASGGRMPDGMAVSDIPPCPIQAPETLVLVHIVAIGWLSLLMCGALFQFVPVLVAHPSIAIRCRCRRLGFLLAGLVALLLGFFS